MSVITIITGYERFPNKSLIIYQPYLTNESLVLFEFELTYRDMFEGEAFLDSAADFPFITLDTLCE